MAAIALLCSLVAWHPAGGTEAPAAEAQEAPPQDTLHHTGDLVIVGTLLDILDDEYVIKTERGTEFYLKERVTSVERSAAPRLLEYVEGKTKEAKKAAHWLLLAEFCKKRGLLPEYRQCLRTYIRLEPSKRDEYRSELGEVQCEGKWLSEKEVMIKKVQGFDIVDGKLVARPDEPETSSEPQTEKQDPEDDGSGEDESAAEYRKGLAALVKEAGRLYSERQYEEALSTIRRAHFLTPENSMIEAMVRKFSQKVAGQKYETAKKLLRDEATRSQGVVYLMESHELNPDPSVAGAIEKLGYRWHLGAWRTSDEIAKFEKEEEARVEDVRTRIELGPEFRVRRAPHFRVFTDIPAGHEWDRWLDPVLLVMEGFMTKYEWLFMGEVDTKAALRGLDVIFVKDRAAYVEFCTKRDIEFSFATAGFHTSNWRCSVFYRHPSHGAVWGTLLHELTHQCNHELLHAALVTWINEGVAQYFEAAIVNKDHTITIGRPAFVEFGLVRESIRGSRSYISAEKIFRANGVDDAEQFPQNSVRLVYATMWGWAYFLLHQDEKHRQLLIDGIRRERRIYQTGAWDNDPRDTWMRTFGDHGFPAETLDEAYLKFIMSIPMTERKKR